MSTKAKAANGGEQSSNGSTDEESETTSTSETTTTTTTEAQSVKDAEAVLAKNRELLAKNKKLDEERKALSKQLQEQEEARLQANEDYKKLAELKAEEAKQEREKRTSLEKSLTDGKKLRKFLDSVPGNIGKQYWGLIDLDKIVVNPETGEPDEDSVKNIARDFEKTYPAVITRKNQGTLPPDAARGAGKDIGFKAEIAQCKTQKEFDAVMRKHGKM